MLPRPGLIPLRNGEVVRLGGRWVGDNGRATASWGGCTIRARFRGPGLTLHLCERGRSRYAVYLDGQRRADATFERGMQQFLWASDHDEGPHEAELIKLTEPMTGSTEFLGLTLSGPAELLPPPPPRPALLVIGDSISAGYGILAQDPDLPFEVETEDCLLTYAGLVAARLSYDLVNAAWSGKGLTTNRGRTDDRLTMRSLWREALPEEPGRATAIDDPSAIVINLGTNDFAPDVEQLPGFEQSYIEFIDEIRAVHPLVPLWLTMGPMLSDRHPKGLTPRSTLKCALLAVKERRAQLGDARVQFLEFRGIRPSEGLGADYHPTRHTQARMADELWSVLSTETRS